MGVLDKAASAFLTVVHTLSLLKPGGKRWTGEPKLNVTVHEGKVGRHSQGKYVVTLRHGKEKQQTKKKKSDGLVWEHAAVFSHWTPTDPLILKLRKAKRCKDATIAELPIDVAAALESVDGLPNRWWYAIERIDQSGRQKEEVFLQVTITVDGPGVKSGSTQAPAKPAKEAATKAGQETPRSTQDNSSQSAADDTAVVKASDKTAHGEEDVEGHSRDKDEEVPHVSSVVDGPTGDNESGRGQAPAKPAKEAATKAGQETQRSTQDNSPQSAADDTAVVKASDKTAHGEEDVEGHPQDKDEEVPHVSSVVDGPTGDNDSGRGQAPAKPAKEAGTKAGQETQRSTQDNSPQSAADDTAVVKASDKTAHGEEDVEGHPQDKDEEVPHVSSVVDGPTGDNDSGRGQAPAKPAKEAATKAGQETQRSTQDNSPQSAADDTAVVKASDKTAHGEEDVEGHPQDKDEEVPHVSSVVDGPTGDNDSGRGQAPAKPAKEAGTKAGQETQRSTQDNSTQSAADDTAVVKASDKTAHGEEDVEGHPQDKDEEVPHVSSVVDGPTGDNDSGRGQAPAKPAKEAATKAGQETQRSTQDNSPQSAADDTAVVKASDKTAHGEEDVEGHPQDKDEEVPHVSSVVDGPTGDNDSGRGQAPAKPAKEAATKAGQETQRSTQDNSPQSAADDTAVVKASDKTAHGEEDVEGHPQDKDEEVPHVSSVVDGPTGDNDSGRGQAPAKPAKEAATKAGQETQRSTQDNSPQSAADDTAVVKASDKTAHGEEDVEGHPQDKDEEVPHVSSVVDGPTGDNDSGRGQAPAKPAKEAATKAGQETQRSTQDNSPQSAADDTAVVKASDKTAHGEEDVEGHPQDKDEEVPHVSSVVDGPTGDNDSGRGQAPAKPAKEAATKAGQETQRSTQDNSPQSAADDTAVVKASDKTAHGEEDVEGHPQDKDEEVPHVSSVVDGPTGDNDSGRGQAPAKPAKEAATKAGQETQRSTQDNSPQSAADDTAVVKASDKTAHGEEDVEGHPQDKDEEVPHVSSVVDGPTGDNDSGRGQAPAKPAKEAATKAGQETQRSTQDNSPQSAADDTAVVKASDKTAHGEEDVEGHPQDKDEEVPHVSSVVDGPTGDNDSGRGQAPAKPAKEAATKAGQETQRSTQDNSPQSAADDTAVVKASDKTAHGEEDVEGHPQDKDEEVPHVSSVVDGPTGDNDSGRGQAPAKPAKEAATKAGQETQRSTQDNSPQSAADDTAVVKASDKTAHGGEDVEGHPQDKDEEVPHVSSVVDGPTGDNDSGRGQAPAKPAKEAATKAGQETQRSTQDNSPQSAADDTAVVKASDKTAHGEEDVEGHPQDKDEEVPHVSSVVDGPTGDNDSGRGQAPAKPAKEAATKAGQETQRSTQDNSPQSAADDTAVVKASDKTAHGEEDVEGHPQDKDEEVPHVSSVVDGPTGDNDSGRGQAPAKPAKEAATKAGQETQRSTQDNSPQSAADDTAVVKASDKTAHGEEDVEGHPQDKDEEVPHVSSVVDGPTGDNDSGRGQAPAKPAKEAATKAGQETQRSTQDNSPQSAADDTAVVKASDKTAHGEEDVEGHPQDKDEEVPHVSSVVDGPTGDNDSGRSQAPAKPAKEAATKAGQETQRSTQDNSPQSAADDTAVVKASDKTAHGEEDVEGHPQDKDEEVPHVSSVVDGLTGDNDSGRGQAPAKPAKEAATKAGQETQRSTQDNSPQSAADDTAVVKASDKTAHGEEDVEGHPQDKDEEVPHVSSVVDGPTGDNDSGRGQAPAKPAKEAATKAGQETQRSTQDNSPQSAADDTAVVKASDKTAHGEEDVEGHPQDKDEEVPHVSSVVDGPTGDNDSGRGQAPAKPAKEAATKAGQETQRSTQDNSPQSAADDTAVVMASDKTAHGEEDVEGHPQDKDEEVPHVSSVVNGPTGDNDPGRGQAPAKPAKEAATKAGQETQRSTQDNSPQSAADDTAVVKASDKTAHGEEDVEGHPQDKDEEVPHVSSVVDGPTGDNDSGRGQAPAKPAKEAATKAGQETQRSTQDNSPQSAADDTAVVKASDKTAHGEEDVEGHLQDKDEEVPHVSSVVDGLTGDNDSGRGQDSTRPSENTVMTVGQENQDYTAEVKTVTTVSTDVDVAQVPATEADSGRSQDPAKPVNETAAQDKPSTKRGVEPSHERRSSVSQEGETGTSASSRRTDNSPPSAAGDITDVKPEQPSTSTLPSSPPDSCHTPEQAGTSGHGEGDVKVPGPERHSHDVDVPQGPSVVDGPTGDNDSGRGQDPAILKPSKEPGMKASQEMPVPVETMKDVVTCTVFKGEDAPHVPADVDDPTGDSASGQGQDLSNETVLLTAAQVPVPAEELKDAVTVSMAEDVSQVPATMDCSKGESDLEQSQAKIGTSKETAFTALQKDPESPIEPKDMMTAALSNDNETGRPANGDADTDSTGEAASSTQGGGVTLPITNPAPRHKDADDPQYEEMMSSIDDLWDDLITKREYADELQKYADSLRAKLAATAPHVLSYPVIKNLAAYMPKCKSYDLPQTEGLSLADLGEIQGTLANSLKDEENRATFLRRWYIENLCNVALKEAPQVLGAQD
ncbi:Hypp6459 [Branchiostoma lanceolatum]|uniref:Hypp6459 protein n=1 Tax=Branchiostoma lanceolatum TaxID=7740 RepID=A0A8J9YUS7_BRALA|nr:Hypp6459 [Branchiostoma lanceolatum]